MVLKKRNKRGQLMLYGVMLAIFIFMFAVILTQPLKDTIILARDADHLDCANGSISTGQRLTCLIVDLYMPYFIGAVIAGSVGYIFMRASS